MRKLGRPLKQMGFSLRGPAKPESQRSRQVKTGLPRAPNYQAIKAEVFEAIQALAEDDRRKIPMFGTLPEQMVALALVWLGWQFQCQVDELGGRLRLGGGVVDIKVWMGATVVVIRVQGDYWHTLPARQRSDLVQLERLRALRYRVWDAWEHAIYQAWVDGRLKQFVEEGVRNAG